jgi:TnpA family transposase
VLRRRLLLVLFALGTNMGIKRVAVTGKHGESEAVLRRVRHLFVNRTNLRSALVRLVNATFAARDAAWWGEGTACASDSKKFGPWSSNFMTEWHQRYRGPGVMIYWHVEKKSLCVYSQLKSCSASEVAAMIEGVLRHCTDVEIDRQCTDTHGASIVGFAFAHTLGFNLLPRLKNVGSARLYRPAAGEDEKWPNLAPVLSSKTIDWDLIGQQYDQIVKYTTALRLGTAEAEQVLRRFTRGGPKHPTYRAIEELGRGTYGVHLRLPRRRGAAARDQRRAPGRGELELRQPRPVLWQGRRPDRLRQGVPGGLDAGAAPAPVGVGARQHPASPGHPARAEVAEAAHRRRPAGPVPAVLDPREPLRPLRARHELPPRPRHRGDHGARAPASRPKHGLPNRRRRVRTGRHPERRLCENDDGSEVWPGVSERSTPRDFATSRRRVAEAAGNVARIRSLHAPR